MTVSDSIYFAAPRIRASDAEREQSLAQLREHWIAGRLDLDEYEQRCAEATQARYLGELAAAARELPAPPAAAVPVAAQPPAAADSGAALALGITGLAVLLLSIGLLFVIALPLSVSAWALGRAARKRVPDGRSSLALAGETIGIVGTVLGCLALTACATIVG